MKKIIIMLLAPIIALYFEAVSYAYSGEMLIFVTPQSIEFNLEDPAGNISGYTPNGIISQLSQMKYEKTAEISSEDEQPENEKFNSLEPVTIPNNYNNGKYRIKLYGSAVQINTRLSVKLVWDSNVQPWSMEYRAFKLVYPNSIWTYEFDVPATPLANGQLVLIKVSNPADLITDINTSNQLGYLGTPGTYQSLLAKAQDAQSKVAAEQPIPAKNVLNALINDINAQRGKQINTIAADILIEDAQYIINHI